MSVIKIVVASGCLLVCAIWAALMWVGTWDDTDGDKHRRHRWDR